MKITSIATSDIDTKTKNIIKNFQAPKEYEYAYIETQVLDDLHLSQTNAHKTVIFVNFKQNHLVPLEGFISKIKNTEILIYLYFYRPEEITDGIKFISKLGITRFETIYPKISEAELNYKILSGIEYFNLHMKLKILNQKIVSDATISEIGRNMSFIVHDIKNPLSVINASLEIIERYQNSNNFSAEKLNMTFNNIKKSSIKINQIIETYSRMLSKQKENENDLFDLNKTIKDCIEFKKNELAKCDITVTFSPENAETKMHGMEQQISQVIVNLINNSIDSVEGQDEKWITILLSSNHDEIVCQITDSGQTIDDVIKAKLMTPFFSTKKSSGTGLGLYICKTIIENHEGHFEILTKDKRNCFRFRIPKFKINHRDQDFPNFSALPKSILIVDDEAHVCEMLSQVFKDAKVKEVFTATTAAKALQIVRGRPIDVVITDLKMPEQNGQELLLQIKKESKIIDYCPKFYVISGYADEETINNLKKIGLKKAFSKPLDLTYLKNVVCSTECD